MIYNLEITHLIPFSSLSNNVLQQANLTFLLQINQAHAHQEIQQTSNFHPGDHTEEWQSSYQQSKSQQGHFNSDTFTTLLFF